MLSVNFAIYTKGYHLVNHSYTGEILSFSSIHIQKVHVELLGSYLEAELSKGLVTWKA